MEGRTCTPDMGHILQESDEDAFFGAGAFASLHIHSLARECCRWEERRTERRGWMGERGREARERVNIEEEVGDDEDDDDEEEDDDRRMMKSFRSSRS